MFSLYFIDAEEWCGFPVPGWENERCPSDS